MLNFPRRCHRNRLVTLLVVFASLGSIGASRAPVTGASAASEQAPVALRLDPVEASKRDYLLHDFEFLDSPLIDQYLQDIEHKLLATQTDRDIVPRIVVYSAADFDAATDSDGIIMISSETLRLLESEDELAALLGHEISHALLEHPRTKTLLNRFPASFQATGYIAAATGQMIASATQTTSALQGKRVPTSKTQTSFAAQSLQTSQDTSLFWTDLLTPSWNRDQERQADRKGMDLMLAAGYDWTAFTTLFEKLHDADVKRSERMKQLRQKMIEQAERKAAANTGSNGSFAALNFLKTAAQSTLSEKAINEAFDSVEKSSKDYDSPTQRQRLLAQYHDSLKLPADGDLTVRSPRFEETLRNGRAGALLKADSAALSTLKALNSGDTAKAEEAVAPLLPIKKLEAPPVITAQAPNKSARAKKSRPTPNHDSARQLASVTDAAAQPPSEDPVLLSPHLNHALGEWYVQQKKPDLAEVCAVRWINSQEAPLSAFLLRAGLQADTKEYVQAIATLEDGERRLGKNLPFLPHMVTYARTAEDMPRAESLTRQCRDEERKQTPAYMRVLNAKPGPTYSECMARLGYDPDKPTDSSTQPHDPAQAPVTARDTSGRN